MLLLAGSATYPLAEVGSDPNTPADRPDEPPLADDGLEGDDSSDPGIPPSGNEGTGEEPEPPGPLPSGEHEYPWDCGSLPHFQSEEQLSRYLVPPTPPPYWEWNPILMGGGPDSPSSSGTTYSGTNNQVEGVDEADITKTDGQYIYTISRDLVKIVEAYPPDEAALISTIEPEDVPIGLFINGDRLVVLTVNGSIYGPRGKWFYEQEPSDYPVGMLVYDISDRSSPILARDIMVTAHYVASRMIGGYVYLVASDFLQKVNGNLTMPSISYDGQSLELDYSNIGSFDNSEGSTHLLVIVALHLSGNEPACYEAFLAPNAAQVYVSPKNIYVASPTYTWSGSYLDPMTESSRIHKVAISRLDIRYVANQTVDGTILDQFSMDEFEGYLRIATTEGQVWRGGGSSHSNVFVLNSTMAVVGSLGGIAPGETIHSARFMRDRVYLVTFMKIDPFFVIDLSDRTAPRILGYLKIPGYSDYLHPFDETHIIGLGKDTVLGEGGGFSWYQGVKLSLFDVADVEHPTEVSKLVIGDRGTDSEALRDHKAFLFDSERGLLVIPLELYLINRTKNPNPEPYTFGDFVWQGAYVISVNIEEGFTIAGTITHTDDFDQWADPIYANYHSVRRSLYIGDFLYVVSASFVTIHDIDSLEEIARLPL